MLASSAFVWFSQSCYCFAPVFFKSNTISVKTEVNTAVQTLHFNWEWRERLCRWHQWISHNPSPLLMFRDMIPSFVEAYQEILSWSPSLLVSQSWCRLKQRLYLWLNISHESQWSTVLTVGRDMTCIWLLASLCFASQQRKKKKEVALGLFPSEHTSCSGLVTWRQ